MSKAVLLDVDRTLFDTDKFRQIALMPKTTAIFGEEASAKIWEFYDKSRDEFGGLVDTFIAKTSQLFGLDISKLKETFYQNDFKDFLYEGAQEFIEDLRKLGYEVILYSNGSIEGSGPFEQLNGFQAEKIRGLGLNPDEVICSENKVKALENNPELKNFEELLHIDDNREVIDATREELTRMGIRCVSIRIDHQNGGFGGVLGEIKQRSGVEGSLNSLSSK